MIKSSYVFCIFCIQILFGCMYAFVRDSHDIDHDESIVAEQEVVMIDCVSGNQYEIDAYVIDEDSIAEPDTSYVFIGDSRFVGMDRAVGSTDEHYWIAEVGAGHDWLINEALPQLDSIADSNPDVDLTVVICLGVNDVYNIYKYIETYKELESTYRLCVVSVNPVSAVSEYVNNDDIDRFNERLQDVEWDIYIDSNNYLMSTGYSTIDGVHYTFDTYRKIYDYICIELNK